MRCSGGCQHPGCCCSARAAVCILEHSETITIFKPEEDEEEDFTMQRLDSEGRTQSNRDRYAQTRAEQGGEGLARRNEAEALRVFIDLPIRFLALAADARAVEVREALEMFRSMLVTIASQPDVGGEVRVNFDVAMSSEADIELNSYCAYIQPTKEVKLENMDWTRLKYLDDDKSGG